MSVRVTSVEAVLNATCVLVTVPVDVELTVFVVVVSSVVVVVVLESGRSRRPLPFLRRILLGQQFSSNSTTYWVQRGLATVVVERAAVTVCVIVERATPASCVEVTVATVSVRLSVTVAVVSEISLTVLVLTSVSVDVTVTSLLILIKATSSTFLGEKNENFASAESERELWQSALSFVLHKNQIPTLKWAKHQNRGETTRRRRQRP